MRRLRIGLDGRALSNINRNRGIGKYSANLIAKLIELGTDFRFVVFGYGDSPDPGLLSAGPPDNVDWVEIPRVESLPVVSVFIDHALFAKAVAKADLSLFHGIDHNMTPLLSRPSIITVHDLILLILRGPYLGPNSWLWMKSHQMAARKAAAIISVSESTRNDVMRLWKIPGGRIRTIYEGVDKVFSPEAGPGDSGTLQKKYGINTPYFLYIGGFDPRKNIGNMLLGFKKFLISGGCDHKFLLCGDPKGFEDYLNNEIEQYGLQNNVIKPGFIPDEDLPVIYRNSTALVFMSLYEGFGLPLLESMACGTPVLTAANSSITEIAHDCAFFADPLDPGEIAQGLAALQSDDDLRRRLTVAGLERASGFSWDRTAGEVLDLYSRVCREEGLT